MQYLQYLQYYGRCGGNYTGALWNFALAVNRPLCGRDARFATNTPGSPLRDNFTLSSLSTESFFVGSLKDGKSKSVYCSLAPVQ